MAELESACHKPARASEKAAESVSESTASPYNALGIASCAIDESEGSTQCAATRVRHASAQWMAGLRLRTQARAASWRSTTHWPWERKIASKRARVESEGIASRIASRVRRDASSSSAR